MNRQVALGLGVVILLAVASFSAPLLTAWHCLAPPLEIDLDAQVQAPSWAHWMGTDEVGRDVLSRVLHGGRVSLAVALVATLVSLGLGVPAGTLAGSRGGVWDLVLTRLMEATTALPALPFILLVVAMAAGTGQRGNATMLLVAAAIGATRWASIARYVRGGIWKAGAEDHTAASIALGAGRFRIFFRHLLPGALTPALVSSAFGAGSAILAESALGFLGMGIQAPLPSWGRMVAAAAGTPQAWWLMVAPGGAIALVVLGFNVAAEGLRRSLKREEFRGQGPAGLRLPER